MGVMRTNCIDCLDRTNVVQSMLARKSLTQQLQKMGILRSGEGVADNTILEAYFKNVWADNADVCSIHYSGTGALKTDYTRTGKRTKLGAMKDGYNSMVRYVKNNFFDGMRQDSMDLFHGKYMVNPSQQSPYRDEQPVSLVAVPMALAVSLGLLILNLLMDSGRYLW